jgi:hypothetical protein
MRNTIVITSVVLSLAAPAAAIAAPAKLSRAEANASARAAAAQAARGLEGLGYHAVSAELDHPQRVGPRRFKTVFGLTATATRAGARDGICLLEVYTWRTRDRAVVSQSNSLTCTRLF